MEPATVTIGDRSWPIRDVLVRGLGRLGGEMIGVGESRKEAVEDHPLGGTAAFYEFNCTAVELSVDRDTGDITIHRHVTVSDVGKSLNPMQVRGQDEGAAVMGLGHTVMEHYILDDEGRIRNLGAIDYRIPTSMDLPLMESDTIENGDGPGPYGAKGMSEAHCCRSRRPSPPPCVTRPASRSATCRSPAARLGALHPDEASM